MNTFFNKLGGGGKCHYCGDYKNNVSYHEAHDCPKRSGKPSSVKKPTKYDPSSASASRGRRWVVCAAMRNKDGVIVTGARHFDSVMRQWFIRKPTWFERIFLRKKFVRDTDWYSCEQGFIDQFGVFMDRREAWKVAQAAGQIAFASDREDGPLFSEDLY
jgi:hypothetical protein